MKCRDVERLLLLQDDDARVDRGQLRAHFRSCGFCRRAFPEVFALATAAEPRVAAAPPVRLERRRWHEVAAAALLAGAIGLAWLAPPSAAPVATRVTAASTRTARPHPRPVDQRLAVTRTEWIDGRRVTSRLERETVHINPARDAR